MRVLAAECNAWAGISLDLTAVVSCSRIGAGRSCTDNVSKGLFEAVKRDLLGHSGRL